MKFLFKLYFVLCACIFASSCKPEDKPDSAASRGSVTLKLNHRFGPYAFETGKEYTSGSNEKLNFTAAKYRLSNISLQRNNGEWYRVPESYYLVDAAEVLSTIELKDIPTGEYVMLEYTIGVDSVRNVSGAQTGSLSPSLGMYWSWNSGYVFIMLEGTSPQSTDGNSFAYHIGGFSGVNNSLQRNNHNFGSALLKVNPDASPQIHLDVDLKHAFGSTVKVAEVPKIHMPGKDAVDFSFGFKNCFTFGHIHE